MRSNCWRRKRARSSAAGTPAGATNAASRSPYSSAESTRCRSPDGGQLQQPLRMAQNGFRKEVAVGKNGDQVSERGRGIDDAIEAGVILRRAAAPGDAAPDPDREPKPAGPGCGSQWLREGRCARSLHLGAGACGIAKLDLFEETRHSKASRPKSGYTGTDTNVIIALRTRTASVNPLAIGLARLIAQRQAAGPPPRKSRSWPSGARRCRRLSPARRRFRALMAGP